MSRRSRRCPPASRTDNFNHPSDRPRLADLAVVVLLIEEELRKRSLEAVSPKNAGSFRLCSGSSGVEELTRALSAGRVYSMRCRATGRSCLRTRLISGFRLLGRFRLLSRRPAPRAGAQGRPTPPSGACAADRRTSVAMIRPPLLVEKALYRRTLARDGLSARLESAFHHDYRYPFHRGRGCSISVSNACAMASA